MKKPRRYNTRVHGLTPLEKMFCLEYLVDLNQTQAAIRAGCGGTVDSAAQWASRTIKKVKVSEFIEARKRERETKLDLKAERMLKKLNTLTEAKLTDFFTIDKKGGLHFKDHSLIDPEFLIALTFSVENPGKKERVSVSLSDKIRTLAFDKLAHYHKIVGADVSVSFNGEDLDRMVVLRASKFDTSGSDVAPH